MRPLSSLPTVSYAFDFQFTVPCKVSPACIWKQHPFSATRRRTETEMKWMWKTDKCKIMTLEADGNIIKFLELFCGNVITFSLAEFWTPDESSHSSYIPPNNTIISGLGWSINGILKDITITSERVLFMRFVSCTCFDLRKTIMLLIEKESIMD